MRHADLLTLNAKDVLNLMVAQSGRTWEDVAAVVGWSPTVLSRVRCATDDYFPKLTVLPRFCVASKSTMILDWVEAQVDAAAVRLDVDALDAKGLLLSMSGLLEGLASAAKAASEAISDDRIGQSEARDIIRKLRSLSAAAVRTISGLRPIAGTVED
ncbi:phage regulatory CII family protein [Desulfovibrio aminophilus]|uniref:phage regulatory CII family protein n=1 Tax=Desulfovibrio aminophilus TaxID=81425 RepID=UPI00040B0417|nr:phage regulatory CII family protein [Desulfovibrio aminophilus]